MFKRVPVEIKREVLEKIKSGMTVAQAAQTYAISTKTIYTWLSNQTRPEISVLEYNRLRRENEELKRIIGLVTLELERGKKIAIINSSKNKKLIAKTMNINRKNIYQKSIKDMRDQTVKSDIENTFLTHPAYGHRRLALELKINHKRVLRVMRKYGLKPPRLWYQEKFTTKEAVLKVGYFPHIFHCDRGGENLSQIVTGYLEKNKTKISVSDPASPWQNAWSESFFSRFKTESGHLNRFETLGELIEYIFSYLNYYNSIRIHTKIKMSPYQFKQKISESGLEKWGT